MKLLNIVSDNKFCIVGNSPNQIGKSCGGLIDSYKDVIRFNDFSVDDQFAKDYGKKVNIWIRGTNDDIIYTINDKKKILKNLDLIIIRAKSDRNSNFRNFLDINNIYYEFLDIKIELELTKNLGFCPSLGLLTLYNFYRYLGPLDKNRVFGFSSCLENGSKDPNGKSIHYYYDINNGIYNPKTKSIEKIKNTFLISKHNWDAEKKFISKLLR
jgi:hypothetical protein